MGAVYRATHEKLRRTFAVKLLATDATMGVDHEATWRLVQEARTASAIDHENIVDVTDLGQTDDGQIYVVMELLKGEDLDDRITSLDGEPMSNEDVRDIGGQMLEGLAAAHEAGVIHRDLKPANVFLSAKRNSTRVKLVDFGMAKALENESSVQLTRSGQLLGTPLYMSPEQSRGIQVDRRSDVYAVGVMLYEMLSGSVPFPATTLYECVLSHATKEPPPLGDRRPDLPASVIEVVHRCLLKEPEERYPDARALADAWTEAWQQADVGATAASNTARLPVADLPESSPKGPLVAVALLGVAALGGGLWWATQSGDQPNEAVGATAPVASEPEIATDSESDSDSDSDSESDSEADSEPDVESAAPRMVTIVSEPPNARVTDPEGEALGRTPLEVEATDAARALRVTLRGYRGATAEVGPDAPDTITVELRRRPSMRNRRVPMLAPR